jgi:hypothetical protein
LTWTLAELIERGPNPRTRQQVVMDMLDGVVTQRAQSFSPRKAATGCLPATKK